MYASWHGYESGPTGVAGLCARVRSAAFGVALRRLRSVLGRPDDGDFGPYGRSRSDSYGSERYVSLGHHVERPTGGDPYGRDLESPTRLILEATCCEVEEVAAIVQILREEIFGSPDLDWVPPDQLMAAARDAYAMLRR